MIVIGADTHKRTHALAAVDNGTGRLHGAHEIAASEAGHLDALIDERTVDAYDDEEQPSGFPSAPTKPSRAASPRRSSASKSKSSRSTQDLTRAPV